MPPKPKAPGPGGKGAGNPPQGELHLLNKVAAVQRAHNVFIDEADNWLTRNVARLGEGFDMQKLAAEPGVLRPTCDQCQLGLQVQGNFDALYNQHATHVTRFGSDHSLL